MASIIILTYNSERDIDECISSIQNQSYKNFEIIIVDNASQDTTVDIVNSKYPGITFLQTGSNAGYAAGNNAGIVNAKGDYIIIINPDTVAEPDWLVELIKPFETTGDVSITTSKILLYNNKELINTCGNHAHFSGLSFCRGQSMPSSEYRTPEYIGTFSGCSFAIRREVVENLGGFDPDFFLYMEDVDLSWRARLAGYKIMYVPTSIIYHKFEFTMAPWKEYYLERNRYIMLLKNYRVKTLVLLFPALAMVELITLGFAIKNGPSYLANKLNAYRWVLANISKILKKRRIVQRSRKISDKQLIEKLEFNILPEQLISNNPLYHVGTYLINYILKHYYTVLSYMV